MLSVLIRHPEFRRLWAAQAISQGGDWLNRIAVLALIGDLQGPTAALGVGALFGVELAIRLLPYALFSPLAGPLADRLPRRFLMVLADVLRSVTVLGYLFVKDAGHLPLLYVLLVLQMSIGIFFQAARSASVPNTVPREDLHAAQALSAATWSFMLTIGALVGGILVNAIGARGVFIADAATYLLSAAFLWRLKLPPTPRQAESFRWRDVITVRDLRRGWKHAKTKQMNLALVAKTFWGGAGGFLVILSIAGRDRFAGSMGQSDPLKAAGLATGCLLSARGLGTALGPILARQWWGSRDLDLRRQISWGFLIAALAYVGFSLSSQVGWALFWVVLAHMGGSGLWVASTTLWQKHIEDAYLGRVFTLEFLGMTMSFALGGLLAGWFYDATQSLNQTIWMNCVLVFLLGTAWTWLATRPKSEN